MRILIATVLAFAAAAAPVVVTGEATDVGPTGATLHGSVNPEGAATTYRFEYGTGTNYGLTAPVPDADAGAGTEPVPVEAPVSGLTANTTYHYRLVATNPSGRTEGEDRTFTTAANPAPPSISGQRVRDVTIDSARLTANVDANGSATTYHFEYGTTTRYGSRTPDRAGGDAADPVPVSEPLAGLRAATRYHWRLVATNAAGTTRGRDRTFITARLPASLSLSLSPATPRWGRPVTLGGRVRGAGVNQTPIALEAQRFPFDAGFTEVATTRAGDDGGYLFSVDHVWATTRYRAVTRTQVPTFSPVVTAFTRVVAGARVRHRSRRRARVEGSILPAVTGKVSLQRRVLRSKRRPSGRRWRFVRRVSVEPTDSVRSRYRFNVRRTRTTRRYRVKATPDAGGAYVRGTSRTVKVKQRPRPRKRRG
jgi:hypothetical protein